MRKSTLSSVKPRIISAIRKLRDKKKQTKIHFDINIVMERVCV